MTMLDTLMMEQDLADDSPANSVHRNPLSSSTTTNNEAMEIDKESQDCRSVQHPQHRSPLPQSAVLFSGLNFYQKSSKNANLSDSCDAELQEAVLPKQEKVYHAAVVRLVNLRRQQQQMAEGLEAGNSPSFSPDSGCGRGHEGEPRYYENTPPEQGDGYLDTDEEGLNEEEEIEIYDGIIDLATSKQVKAVKRRQPSELEPFDFWINKKNGFSHQRNDKFDTSEQAHHPTSIPAPWPKSSTQQSTGLGNRNTFSQSIHSGVDALQSSSKRVLFTSRNPFHVGLNSTPNNTNSSIYQDEDQDNLQAEYRQLHSLLATQFTSQADRNGSNLLNQQQQRRKQRRQILSSTFSLHQDQSTRANQDLSTSSSPPQSTERHRRPPTNIARGLIDLARGQHNNSRSQHQQQRRIIQAKLQSATTARSISPAHPQNFTHSFVDEAMHPYKFDVVLNMPLPSREEMERHAWNPDDRSLNIYVKEEDRLTLHRHPVAQSTDCIRGKIGYTRGFHVWQLVWPVGQRGTHPLVGVATKECALHATGYNALIGSNTESYGWDIVQNKCYHDSRNTKGWTYPNLPSTSSMDDSLQTTDKFYCILDCDEGYMAFATPKQYLGVAFRGLKGKKLYPIVSAVWGHCEVTIRYMGGLDPEPRQLMDVCRRTIRLQMGKTRLDRIHELKLPPALMHYLLYKS